MRTLLSLAVGVLVTVVLFVVLVAATRSVVISIVVAAVSTVGMVLWARRERSSRYQPLHSSRAS